MNLDEIIIRDFKAGDAEEFYNIYKEEYGSYFEFNNVKELRNRALKNTSLTKVLELNDKIIGGYFVTYDPKQRRSYPHGLIIKKEYRNSRLYHEFVINPKNFNKLLSDVFNKFSDVDIFYAISRGYSKSANSACDLMGFKYNGLIPFMHKMGGIREPGMVRLLYPEATKSFKPYYNKKLFDKWSPPSVIPELKDMTNIIIKLCGLKEQAEVIDIKSNSKGYKLNKLLLRQGVYKISVGIDEVLLTINEPDESATMELKVFESRKLQKMIKKSLKYTKKKCKIISVNAHTIEEQRALYDLGFKPAAYIPLLDLINGERIDAHKFIKLQGKFDFEDQKRILLERNNSYKARRLINVVLNEFINN